MRFSMGWDPNWVTFSSDPKSAKLGRGDAGGSPQRAPSSDPVRDMYSTLGSTLGVRERVARKWCACLYDEIVRADLPSRYNYSPPALRLAHAIRAGGHGTTLKKLIDREGSESHPIAPICV